MTTKSDYIGSIATSLCRILSCTDSTETLESIDRYVYELANNEEEYAIKRAQILRQPISVTGPDSEYAIEDFLSGLEYAGFFTEIVSREDVALE